MKLNPVSRVTHAVVVLAMSADGKIADASGSPARFGSKQDKAHLERQVAAADAVLFGAGTLRAYGTTLSVRDPDLLQQRQEQHKPPQPVQIVCSPSGKLDLKSRFFRQPVPRWLLTTKTGCTVVQEAVQDSKTDCTAADPFERTITQGITTQHIDWPQVFDLFAQANFKRLAVLGGGQLVASLLAADCVDEILLTVCPLILGGSTAPSPVQGDGWPEGVAPRLELLSTDVKSQEVFLHYRLRR
ncbi:MAG: RibD family protein [Thainema sp.]